MALGWDARLKLEPADRLVKVRAREIEIRLAVFLNHPEHVAEKRRKGREERPRGGR